MLTSEGAMHHLLYRQQAIENALVITDSLGEEDVREFLRIIRKISDITNSSEKISVADKE